MYLPIIRDQVPAFLTLFDYPTPSEVKGRRVITTIAPQALFFMNSAFVIDQAESLSENLLSDPKLTDQQRLQQLFVSVYGRKPDESEVAVIARYLDGEGRGKKQEQQAWAKAIQSLFAASECSW